MQAAELARELGAKKNGSGWLARCPVHKDKHPSLRISEGDKEDVVIVCRSGCAQEDVIHALQEQGVWPEAEAEEKPRRRAPRAKGAPDATYQYTTADSELLFEKQRFNLPRGKKRFVICRPDGKGGWIEDLGEFNKTAPLYRADLVKDAADNARMIFLVEGEKDADNVIAKFGFRATTNYEGAGKWRERYTEALKGAVVVILPDNDGTGDKHAQTVAGQLKQAGIFVRVVRLPDLPAKGDVSDWIALGGSKEKLIDLCKNTPAWEPEAPCAHNGTELAAARLMVQRHGNSLRYTAERGWMSWDGKRWAPSNVTAMRFAKDTVLRLKDYTWAKQFQTVGKCRAIMDLAQSEDGILASLVDFDTQPDLVNCANGILDLRTGELRKHERDLMFSKIINVEYDPAAKCDLWERFLMTVMDEDWELIAYLQRAVGYSLTGHNSEQVFLYCHGNGANGKSVFLETLKVLFGEYGQVLDSSSLMHQSIQRPVRNDIAKLAGARFVAVSETSQGDRLDEGTLKKLTGDDEVTACFKYKEEFDFRPQMTMWMRGNHKPEIRGTDPGIWRRIHLVPFLVEIPPEERDRNLRLKLLTELPGIFNWAVQGCFDWRRVGLHPPRPVLDATEEYRKEQDVIGLFIFERCDTTSTKARIAASDLYREYARWCEVTGHRAVSLTKFGRLIKERGFGIDHQADANYYLGIDIHNTKERVSA